MSDSVSKFLKIWPEEIASLLGQMGFAGATASSSEPRPSAAVTQELISKGASARFIGAGALKGELSIACDYAAALTLAQAFMSEPIDPAIEFSSTHRDAFLELIRQVAGVTATDWKAEVGRDVVLSFHSASEPPFVGATEISIEVRAEQFVPLTLQLSITREMEEVLAAVPPAPAPTAEPTRASDSEPPTEPRANPAGALPSNLDLLLDVELEATIRFGEREMLLKEIYGLMPGTVIELDQMINEPAQLLVAGRTVAWGEVVVVDGNFGLRVTEVASKNQRAEMVLR